MSRNEIGGMLGALVILVFGVFTISTIDTYLLRNSSLAAVISAVLVDLTNGDRTSSNLGGLTVNPLLVAAAQAKANDMAEKGYFAHVSPSGENSWYWFKQAGYSFLYAGENLAVDFSDSSDVEQAWMNSPTHRANILNGNFTQVGIATAQGVYDGHETTFVVSMFGTPAPVNQPVAAVQTIASPTEPTALALATTKPAVKPAVKPIAKPLAAATSTKVVAVATTTLAASSTAVATVTAEPTAVLGAVADSILPPQASWWQRLLASPKLILQYTYLALGVMILGLLAYVTELEFHKRHIRHVAAVAFLFVLMAGLFTFANLTFFSEPVIAAQTN